ncbi:hypothetical protein EI94DRAFT_1701476 [Lactarius quietus]|nr:hypothetical protein EI94DRAFT_1701476 [Lactarius quietus]
MSDPCTAFSSTFGARIPVLAGSNSHSRKTSLWASPRGMTCGDCVESIEGMLKSQPGIHSVKVAVLAEGGVEFDSQQGTNDNLKVNNMSTIVTIFNHFSLKYRRVRLPVNTSQSSKVGNAVIALETGINLYAQSF